MKTNLKLVSFAALLALLCSCVEQFPVVAPSNARVRIRAFCGTKSSLQVEEDAVSNLNVFFYSGGLLYHQAYCEAGQMDVELDPNREYMVYALANCCEVDAPYLEEDLGSLELEFPEFSSVAASGAFPMCCREGRALKMKSATAYLDLPLVRLVSKVSLKVEKELEGCELEFSSLEIRQEALSVYPFQLSGKAAGTRQGDCASAADLEALARGEQISFYVLENCRGVLLPDNTDPWAKVPSSIPDEDELCTYMHLEGKWNTSGASADLSLNLYLGQDNCSDFNVVRNVHNSITLTITDNGLVHSNWKVNLDNLQDSRCLQFEQDSYTLNQNDSWTELPLEVYPPDMSYFATLEQSEENIECRTINGKVYVRPVYDGDEEQRSAQIVLSSFDKLHKTSIRVDLVYDKGVFTDYSGSVPEYEQQWSSLSFPSASAARPLRFTTPVGRFMVGQESETRVLDDPDAGLRYYYLPEQKMVCIHRYSEGGASSVELKLYKDFLTLDIPASELPQLAADDAYTTEGGGGTFYRPEGNAVAYNYDSSTDLYLMGKDGGRLDPLLFRVPDAMLDYFAMDSDAAWRQFYEQIACATYYCFAFGYYCNYFLLDYESLGEIVFTEFKALARLLVYGISDVPGDGMRFDVESSLNGLLPLKCTSKLRAYKAFPRPRHLGSIMNYQLAPGDLRSSSADLDFTSGGTLPPPMRLSSALWQIRQTTDPLDTDPETAFANASVTNFSKSVKIDGYKLTFKDMTSDYYPACGSFVAKGWLQNPHNGKSYTGYYRFDIVLYLSVGCKYIYKDASDGNCAVGISYVPFCEQATAEMSDTWKEILPFFLCASNVKRHSSFMIGVPADYESSNLKFEGEAFVPASTVPDAMSVLVNYKEDFDFLFNTYKSSYVPTMLFDREGIESVPLSGISCYSDGRNGYFYLVRQCDVNNLPADEKNNGLDNYFVEAAYGI